MRSSSWPRAVSISIGTSEPARIRRQTSKPSRSGQHHVEEHRGERARCSSRRRPSRAVPLAAHLEAERPQVVGHEPRERRVVLDHQDALGHGRHPAQRAAAAGGRCASAQCPAPRRRGSGGRGRGARALLGRQGLGDRSTTADGHLARGLVGEGDLLPCAARSIAVAVDLRLRELARDRLAVARGASRRAAPARRSARSADAPGLLLLLVARVHAAQQPLERHPACCLAAAGSWPICAPNGCPP